MNKRVVLYLVAYVFLFAQCGTENTQQSSEEVSEEDMISNVPKNVRILMSVYPDFVIGYSDGCLLLADSTSLLYDDGQNKSFEEKLDNADPEDMFAFTYDRKERVPEYLQDAGRSRCESLFKYMYGGSESEVRNRLIDIDWFGEKIRFTPVNGAADSLMAVANEIKMHPELKQYLKCSGTFYWRPVRGANRLSAHSYGMTIDIGVDYSNYWLWDNQGKGETDTIVYANQIPYTLVDIFERHGFIWGGRWYHYDTMHFEFRPEILLADDQIPIVCFLKKMKKWMDRNSDTRITKQQER